MVELRKEQARDMKIIFEAVAQSKTENSNHFTAEGIANSISEFQFHENKTFKHISC